jgi:hypothetical protein
MMGFEVLITLSKRRLAEYNPLDIEVQTIHSDCIGMGFAQHNKPGFPRKNAHNEGTIIVRHWQWMRKRKIMPDENAVMEMGSALPSFEL